MGLEEIRKKIDRVDRQLVRLLGERLELAVRTRKHKTATHDPDREETVLANVRQFGTGLLRRDYLEALFRQIIAESHRMEDRQLKLIGFQGDHGSYSEMAALRAFPGYAPISMVDFRDVFEKVEAGDFDFAIVPVENSTEGTDNEVHDLLVEKDLHIAAEIDFPVHHQLMALPSASVRDIHTLYSHPLVLAQCRRFIERRKLKARPFHDTAGAARWLTENRIEDAAVIAGNLCAELYGLKIMEKNIEDAPRPITRFLALSRIPSEDASGAEKSSLILSTRHQTGAMHQVLHIFAEASLNLTRIESRPVKGDPGHCFFFIDFLGTTNEPCVAEALTKIRAVTKYFKFLGSYRKV